MLCFGGRRILRSHDHVLAWFADDMTSSASVLHAHNKTENSGWRRIDVYIWRLFLRQRRHVYFCDELRKQTNISCSFNGARFHAAGVTLLVVCHGTSSLYSFLDFLSARFRISLYNVSEEIYIHWLLDICLVYSRKLIFTMRKNDYLMQML